MDPLVIGGAAARALVTKAVAGVATSAIRRVWGETDELGRLFGLMEAAFADKLPAITQAELERAWRPHAVFIQAFGRLSTGEQVSDSVLVDAIEPLVGAAGDRSERDVATELAQGLRLLLPEAKDDTPRVLFEVRQFENRVDARFSDSAQQLERIEATVTRASEPLLILSSDWPSAAGDALKRAGAVDKSGLRQLMQALDAKERAGELATLINRGRGWMDELSGAVWELMAVLCEEDGLWHEAQRAWLTARDRAGADWADCTLRAAEAAVQAGDRAAAVRLLDAARDDDATHPRVLFHDALRKDDPRDTLSAFQLIQTDDSALTAAIEVARAGAHVELRDLAAARAALAAAADAGAGETLSYRITEVHLSVRELLDTERPSAAAAPELAAGALQLENDLLKRNRLSQAAGVRGDAAAFHALVGDIVQAQALLADAIEIYDVDNAEPRLQLATAAANLHGYDIIERLVRPTDDDDRARFLRAVLRSRGDDEDKRAAAQELDEFITHDDVELRTLAALRRLGLSGETSGIGWNDDAEQVVTSHHPAPAAIFKAFWLENTERRREAERELLAHSDETWAVSELMRLAGRTQDWPKAARYAAALLGRELAWDTHIMAAEALRLSGDVATANGEFRKLAGDADAPAELRAAAYRRLTAVAVDTDDHAATLSLASAWLDVEPDSGDAAWLRVMALAMLGHDDDALRAIAGRGLRPRQPAEYRIAAQLYVNVGEPNEALAKVVEFADEHKPPSEEMEAFVVFAGMRASTVPQELRERVSAARFIELFPASDRWRAVSFDDFIAEYVEQALPERARRIQAAEQQVLDQGQLPSAVLALVANENIAGLWMRLSAGPGLPLGYGNAQLGELERQDARTAVGGPVVWDATSVFVVNELSSLTETIRTSFPTARITQSALADIAESVRTRSFQAGDRQDARADAATSGSGEGHPDAGDADRARVRAALALAHKLQPCVDADPAAPQPEDSEHEDITDSAFRSLLATYSAARRLALPIYSDDRDVRRRARANGLPAFGTLALLDVLAETEHISVQQRAAARRQLLAMRARGVRPDVDELHAMGRQAAWEPTLELTVALQDRGPWAEDAPDTFLAWHKTLRHVHRDAPAKLAAWVTRFIQAAHQARPELSPAFLATHLVMMSLLPTDGDATKFARAIIAAVERSRPSFTAPLGDPPLAGFAALVSFVARAPRRDIAEFVVSRAWTMLPLADQPRTLHVWAP